MVHHWMLPRPQRHSDDTAGCHGAGDQPRDTDLVVAGDFNTDLGETASDGRGTEIAAALTEAGIEDMTAHFLPRFYEGESADYLWHLQYQEREERGTGTSAPGNGPGQH